MTRPIGAAAPSSSLPTRNAFHLTRKCFHCLSGLLYALLARNLPHSTWRALSLSLVALVFLTEFSRLRHPAGPLNALVLSSFRPFMRHHETHQLSGMLYYTLGVALCTLLYSRTTACLAILCLSVLDPIAALIGVAFEPHLPELRLRNGKSLAAFIVAAFAAILVVFTALCFNEWTTLPTVDALSLAVVMGVLASFTELLVPSPQIILGWKSFPFGIDDNLFIPLVAGAVCEYLLTLREHQVELSPLLLYKLHSS
ncbi:CTP-dependent diacylglycerol kinase 1 [Gracilariopsis chorda]|uniref:CTP-dependent diacylglycerol kinase 1 n=1 Tax=Gracilariopsis chorda TaxID=448386 RepID=A0A2V3J492_9FLOR|nr:CTP-dependent diacylglycerol kinase 1 [Gracilariopsis chorda]|eukprot:PXF49205.1 CTP-dependent diacylglycerol kinase 1 [Gracilariopsis chorda]